MVVQPIPLSQLIPSRTNVRRTGGVLSLDELAASIAAHGLLQNLQVRAGEDGKFKVVAGKRRLLALKRLAKSGHIPRSAEIPCHVLDTEDDTEISLAENLLRLPLHPADQYDAFCALADQGKGPEDIAARFGCSPHTVKQRLRLGSVAPSLLAAFRKDEIDLDQLMALAITDDQAAQRKVWGELPVWDRHPATIRRLLTQAHVAATDRRAVFVGIDAYVAAGGPVVRDLFQPEHEGYLTNPALLQRLVIERLDREAETVRAEGWKWIEIMPDVDYGQMHHMRRVSPERIPLDGEQQAELDRLSEEYDALAGLHGDDPPAEIADALERLSVRIDQLSEAEFRWRQEDIERAGVIIGIRHGGRLVIERGLLRPEDNLDVEAAPASTLTRRAARTGKIEGLPEHLVEMLTVQRTAALQALLGDNADVALSAIVHALALAAFYPFSGASGCLTITSHPTDLRAAAEDIETSPAAALLAKRHADWTNRLPAHPDALWEWLDAQDMPTRLDLLAHCVAGSVNAVKKPHERGTECMAHSDALASRLALDMTQWWQPTDTRYLRHVTKARILEAVAEGVSPQAAENLAKLKKDALIAEAERRLAETGWLPSLLRVPVAPMPETVEAMAAE